MSAQLAGITPLRTGLGAPPLAFWLTVPNGDRGSPPLVIVVVLVVLPAQEPPRSRWGKARGLVPWLILAAREAWRVGSNWLIG